MIDNRLGVEFLYHENVKYSLDLHIRNMNGYIILSDFVRLTVQAVALL